MNDGEGSVVESGRLPNWLRRELPSGQRIVETNTILRKYGLNAVCEEAKCPNRLECYARGTTTFLVLGSKCTRNCGFCSIDFDQKPLPPEPDEPERIASAALNLSLKHVVITMVARDDLPDGGAAHVSAVICAIRLKSPGTSVEVLTSDFSGNFGSLDVVLRERPETFNHNIETVRSLTPRVRHRAEYSRTLSILKYASESKSSIYVKSGIMLGLGETEFEVKETIDDLADAGCGIITIGQYLQPTKNKLRVKEFIPPMKFKEYEAYGLSIGIRHMYCGPFVRSSYNADLFI